MVNACLLTYKDKANTFLARENFTYRRQTCWHFYRRNTNKDLLLKHIIYLKRKDIEKHYYFSRIMCSHVCLQ